MDGLRVENDPTNLLLAQTKKENGRLIEESQEIDEEQNGEALGDGNATGNDDEAIRTYIQQHIKKFGGVSTENVRKTFAIGWIRAKRLHDQEMGLKTDEVRYASDEKLRGYIRRCFEEKGSCSVNHLRQEFSVGYNRAKKILDEEKERVEYGEREPEGALLLGLSGEDDLGRKGRGKNRPTHKSPRPADATFDDARMQGLEEDVSYLLGMGMGVHVTQRERKRGRTEDESICETALNTLLAINESEPDTRKSSSGPDRAARLAAKWAMLENAREELQRKLEEAKEKRKLLRGRAKDSASESRRRRASKLMETTLGASMSKVKAKLAEIESLREQLDREVRRSKEERQGAAAGLPYTPMTERTETEGERMLTRKRRREANNGRGIESSLGVAERLHKLLESTANLAKELSEQHDAIRALPRFGSSAAFPSLPDLAPTVALTSSLLSACLLSMTTHSLRSEETEGELTPSPGTSASTSPILLRRSLSPAAQSPVPVTFTYPVPALSSQEFIKSLEALTCSSSSSLLSTSPSPSFSSSLGGSLSFTIPCAPPPSLASSLSFTSLPPPLPTFTDAGSDGVPSSSSSSSSTTVFFPPPPLPTLPVSSAFPASFPYVDYIVGVQPAGSEAATSYTPIVPSSSPSDAAVGDNVEIRTAKPNGQKRRRGRGAIVKPVERDGGGSQTNEEDEWRVEMQVGDGSDEEEGGGNDETPRNINANTDTNGSSVGDQDESEEAPVKRKRGRPRRGQEKKARR